MDNNAIFNFLADELRSGRPAILVTVIAVTGSSMRDPGAHMAVAADGRFAGSLSGGCIESAVVAEARDALSAGHARIVRFGAGSLYIDIKLPCGGGLDVHFQPLAHGVFAEKCLAAVRSRSPFSMRFEGGGDAPQFFDTWQGTSLKVDGSIMIGHWPAPRLMIIGHGEAVVRLAELAQAMDLDIQIATPEADICEDSRLAGVQVDRLRTTDDCAAIISDPWTAIIFLFHDHDWEDELLIAALAMPYFYIGAMGGKTAHLRRAAMLKNRGVADEKIAGLRAPIGLFHSARDPDTLAISILSEVMKIYQNTDFSDGYG